MLVAVWFVLAGVGIVFATLSVLMLAMAALGRWLGAESDNRRRSRHA